MESEHAAQLQERIKLLISRVSRLKELQSIQISLFGLQSLKFGENFADLVADAQFALAGNHLVILLILQKLLAKRVIAVDLPAQFFVLLNF